MMGTTGVYVEDPCHKQWEAERKALEEFYRRDEERFAKLTKREQYFELSMRYQK